MVKAVITENINKTETAIPSSSSVSTSNNVNIYKSITIHIVK